MDAILATGFKTLLSDHTPLLLSGDAKGGAVTPFRDWSDKEISTQLAGSFDKFEDPENKGFITLKSLKQAATDPARSGLSWDDSMLAQEILDRPELMRKLDADGKGNVDGKIDKQSIQNVINPKRAQKGVISAGVSDTSVRPFGLHTLPHKLNV